jgi:hypothetical protein
MWTIPFFPTNTTLDWALRVLTSMITPALLISATGTFILSTSTRLGRVVDRVRVLSEKIETLIHDESKDPLAAERREMYFGQMAMLSRRARQLQSALTFFYLAAGAFVLTSVEIGIAAVISNRYNFVPVIFGIFGCGLLMYGAMILIFEARLALRSLDDETDFLAKVVKHQSELYELRLPQKR